MAPPNGPRLARSTSTWIHWWSPVASANASTRCWVTSSHSVVPRSPRTAADTSATVVKLRMARNLSPGGPVAVRGRPRGCLGGVRHGRGDHGAVRPSYAVAAPRRRCTGDPGTLVVERDHDRLAGADVHELAAHGQLRCGARLEG